MDRHIPGFKIANGNLKARKATDDVKKTKKLLKFDSTPVVDEVYGAAEIF